MNFAFRTLILSLVAAVGDGNLRWLESRFRSHEPLHRPAKIRPVVDRVFPYEEAAKAYDFMDNGSYFGKIVIRVDD